MAAVVVEVWENVYVVEVEVGIEWISDVSAENPVLSTKQHSVVKPISLPPDRSREVQSTDYIQDLIYLDP